MAKQALNQQPSDISGGFPLASYQQRPSATQADRALLEIFPYPVVVLNLDETVSYVNPAFTIVFGWTLEELEAKRIPFIPNGLEEEARQMMQQLLHKHILHNLSTKRSTKDCRVLEVLLDGALVYKEGDAPSGQVIALRDVTRETRVDRSNRALFRISEKLHHFQRLDELLEFITNEVQELLNVGGAMVILLDEETQEFFFRVATLDDIESGQKMKELRFPLNKGVAGHVYNTGQPLIVADTSKSPYFLRQVDEESGYQTRNMLDVPLKIQDHRIGVLCTVNKKDGEFDQDDVDLLSTIAGTIALPIENARIHEELQCSYEEVKSLNRAKDRVIHHLSHELKTPVSVLSASLNLLRKRLSGPEGQPYLRILDRAQRNLQRILDMQYEIEDILRERQYTTYHLLSILLDACVDELEVLVADELGEWSVMQRIRRRVEELFGPSESISRKIQIDRFVRRQLEKLRSRFTHRACQIITRIESTPPIWIPPDVLAKVIEGLIRNAVENTPDGGRIEVNVRDSDDSPELEVKDYGIGMTEENQRLLMENYFPTYEIMRYSSRNSFDFNAGGKGFDLLRMRIFSERYNFKLHMMSRRCRYIPRDDDVCPGAIERCEYCQNQADCFNSGGTSILIQFARADSTE